jgi:hypothetical protein
MFIGGGMNIKNYVDSTSPMNIPVSGAIATYLHIFVG